MRAIGAENQPFADAAERRLRGRTTSASASSDHAPPPPVLQPPLLLLLAPGGQASGADMATVVVGTSPLGDAFAICVGLPAG